MQAEGWKFDPAKAVEILEGGRGQEGLRRHLRAAGRHQARRLEVDHSDQWTDWNTACEIVAKSVKEVGIGISTEFPQAPTAIARWQNGDFDLCMNSYTGVNPASPWIRFRDALDDRGVPDYGKSAFWNYNRFKNSEVAAHLDAAAGAKSDAEAKTAYAALDKIYRENVPVVPLMYRPLEFTSSTRITGRTSQPRRTHTLPMWQGAGIQWLFKIKKVGT